MAFKGGSSVLTVNAPAIIVTDLKFHQPDADKPAWGHYDYFWEPWSESEFEVIEASTVVMTLGSLANSHPYLRNIQPSGENEYNNAVLDRGKDPVAGAFSYHRGFNFAATRDIEVGEEIYASYVKTWFEERGYDLLDESNVIKAYTVINIMKQENRGLIGKDSGKVAVVNYLESISDIMSIFDKHSTSLLPKTLTEFIADKSNNKSLGKKIKKNVPQIR